MAELESRHVRRMAEMGISPLTYGWRKREFHHVHVDSGKGSDAIDWPHFQCLRPV
ncbi:hypothetical protein L195_g057872 [Trifolium pratense]|uniref:Uncharacterized protein n=1 Tax=Trifolium pratense TaxID=57577 RepID=A0A2K3KXA5_TRIPR|nr:hypothetical protein L195_g057872 [Trifolium pratense]